MHKIACFPNGQLPSIDLTDFTMETTANTYYSCGLSTATIEYSCPSACLSVFPSFRLSVCVSMYKITQKNNDSIHLKLEHVAVFENSSDEFDIGHCPIKVKVTA